MKPRVPYWSLFFGVIILLIIYIVPEVVHCGQQPSTAGKSVTKAISLYSRITYGNIIIKGKSGSEYLLETSLHAVKDEFINNLTIKHLNGIELTPFELLMAWRHMFLSFRLDNFDIFLRKEMNLEANPTYQLDYDNFIISMFLTKESLSYINNIGGSLNTIENFQFSEQLLSGGKSRQFLGAIIQVYNSTNWFDIISSFNDIEKIKNITNNKGLEIIKNNFVATQEQNYLIQNTVGDLYNIVENNGRDKLNNWFSINKLEFGPKTILLEKDIINENTSLEQHQMELKKYFEFVAKITEKK